MPSIIDLGPIKDARGCILLRHPLNVGRMRTELCCAGFWAGWDATGRVAWVDDGHVHDGIAVASEPDLTTSGKSLISELINSSISSSDAAAKEEISATDRTNDRTNNRTCQSVPAFTRPATIAMQLGPDKRPTCPRCNDVASGRCASCRGALCTRCWKHPNLAEPGNGCGLQYEQKDMNEHGPGTVRASHKEDCSGGGAINHPEVGNRKGGGVCEHHDDYVPHGQPGRNQPPGVRPDAGANPRGTTENGCAWCHSRSPEPQRANEREGRALETWVKNGKEKSSYSPHVPDCRAYKFGNKAVFWAGRMHMAPPVLSISTGPQMVTVYCLGCGQERSGDLLRISVERWRLLCPRCTREGRHGAQLHHYSPPDVVAADECPCGNCAIARGQRSAS